MKVVVKIRQEKGTRPAPGRDQASKAFGPRHSALDARLAGASRERGVALVITLIMLSVITFMAIAFLVLSRGERSSVGTATDQSIARLGADNALERAQVELLAPMLASGNFASAGLLVSTNYINPVGFKPGISNPTNVSYVDTFGKPIAGGSMLQNLTNLLINPRPPVYIVTNRVKGLSDFRYFLDLNRNGIFDPTGITFVTNSLGVGVKDKSGTNLVDYVQGDPQWIGGLEFPDRNHSADNRFLYRYAYLAIPASQTLDINYVHNAARASASPFRNTTDPNGGDFMRNQGVGTWEINLAGFFYDLNTNNYAWGGRYIYDPFNGSVGNSFLDAYCVLTNRYGFGRNYQLSLSSVSQLFQNGPNAFINHFMDGYGSGPIMNGVSAPTINPDTFARIRQPWPGADNTNHYFSMQELFDPAKTSLIVPSLSTRLLSIGTNVSTYDRYTYYRLLSQLGTDSAPEPPGKINLNYDNLVQPNGFGIVSATNFFAWRPIDFFTNAANMLLTNAGYTLNLTNLQVYPTNFYTPSIHRLLQLAANIYDASTNRVFAAGQTNTYFPTVFRPIFRRIATPTNVVITIVGYREVQNSEMATRAAPLMIDPTEPGAPIARIPVYGTPFASVAAPGAEKLEPMIAGIPLVIGAKKGFPNFNEFSAETQIYVSRLLEFRRAANDGPVTETNQMYVVGISNLFGLEAWNSYMAAYPRNIQLVTSATMEAVMTNEFGSALYSNRQVFGMTTNIQAGNWKGYVSPSLAQYSMVLPFGNNANFRYLTNSTFRYPGVFAPLTHEFVRGQGLYVPHWWLNLKTRVQFILVDTSATPNRIIDYVNLRNQERTVDITYELSRNNTGPVNPADYNNDANQWLTNRVGGSASPFAPTLGIINQIQIGLNGAPAWLSFSQDPYAGQDPKKAVAGFRYNLMGLTTPGEVFYKSNIFYAPYDPYRPLYVHTTWQANDPLVHYNIGDLVDSLTFDETNRVNTIAKGIQNIGRVNDRYRPWGGNSNPDPLTDTQMAIKDPNVTRSDDWDFPTNKFPNIGWLGRVHRGTPWQTVFLKSTNTMQVVGGPNGFAQSLLNWMRWTGNPTTIGKPALTNMISPALVKSLLGTNANVVFFDALFTAPTNDWHILDLFSTAFNDNAGRGQLSVNQTNLAAWSAVLSGVNVLPNLSATNWTPTFIKPAGADTLPRLANIVNGINNARTNFPNHAFARLGDVLSAPELTVASPYLLSTNRAQIINDEVIERIPQQILGLLHGGEQPPRFVIYSYGQALKPGPKSFYMGSGPYFGLCTNYQITAEVATRAVVRIEGAPTKPRTVVESFTVLPPD